MPAAPAHTGAGRIVSIRMRPMSLAERGRITQTISLKAHLDKLAPTVSSTDVAHLHWLRERLGPDLVDAAVVTTRPQGGHVPTAYRARPGRDLT